MQAKCKVVRCQSNKQSKSRIEAFSRMCQFLPEKLDFWPFGVKQCQEFTLLMCKRMQVGQAGDKNNSLKNIESLHSAIRSCCVGYCSSVWQSCLAVDRWSIFVRIVAWLSQKDCSLLLLSGGLKIRSAFLSGPSCQATSQPCLMRFVWDRSFDPVKIWIPNSFGLTSDPVILKPR